MNLERRIAAFAGLGSYLRSYPDGNTENGYDDLREAIDKAERHNAWFTRENILLAIANTGNLLDPGNLREWLGRYDKALLEKAPGKKIGVIMAGNIPMVGFHDMLCVLISGHEFIGKLSAQDAWLIPFLANQLISLEPGFADRITFSDQLKDFQAVIATGSNNSSRYFEYYFGRYPHIIRKNRNSIAVLDGNEDQEQLSLLARDLFSYFGMGCRNVSKLFVPSGYSFNKLLGILENYPGIINHHKYLNNYDYVKSVYLINRVAFLDNGCIMLKEDKGFSPPASVLFYEYYTGREELEKRLEEEKEHLQCIVSSSLKNVVPFGSSQEPALSDYADGVDTLKFLLDLK